MIGVGREDRPLREDEWKELVDQWLTVHPAGERVLLVPPDITRRFSYAGEITTYLWKQLCPEHEVSVLPAVGTHMPMSADELHSFFPGIPDNAFLIHDWRSDNVSVGMIPADFVFGTTGGRYTESIDVQLDNRLLSGEYDTIISIGQVVPHEVVGMANYTKNLVVGFGGRDIINRSHMVGAVCNLESIMGNTDTPVRAIFDYIQREFLDRIGVVFFLTVAREKDGAADLFGLYIGTERAAYEAASKLAARKNITWLSKRVDKLVAYLEPSEFRSTWVGNKAIYRTRMAIADNGELLILAPGVRQFGEDTEVDNCIRKYGYCGTEQVIHLYREHAFDNLEMVAAHLIHGSSEGRFRITYATDPTLLGQHDVESVGFQWTDVRPLLNVYRPEQKETGTYFSEKGEQFYFVKAPAVGLWRV